MGLHFAAERLPELEQKMASLGREAGFGDLESYLLRLMSAPLSREQLDTLARTLTIGETYFLRDPRSYQLLVEKLLPELIASRRATGKTLRIWSAGCSSGEEPYTIAILLSRAIPDLASWQISLLATDINPVALERGRRGIYSQWSFRNAPPWLMDYFSKRKDGRRQIAPHIRKMVRFRHLNLADNWMRSAGDGTGEVDIIFCRNVMLYFDAAQIEKTMARFHAALNDSGWLFVGPTEVNHHAVKGFSCRHEGGCFVLRKSALLPGTTATPHPPILAAAGAAPDRQGAVALPRLRTLPRVAPLEAAARAPAATSGASIEPDGNEAGEGEQQGESGLPQALALYQAGEYRQAAELALLSPGGGEEQARALALAARAYANIGSFAQARECCESSLTCDRLDPRIHYLLSIILEQQGESTGAIRSLQRALYLDNDYLLAYFALGHLYRQAGNHRESERNFANALRLLDRREPHEVLEDAEGITAGSLAETIRAMTSGAGK
jgi:chemotaxis protein methyltransferase CheR